MTKKAKELQPGDVLAAGGKVSHVHPEGDDVHVLFEDRSWAGYWSGATFNVKPSTIKASEVKSGMTVRLIGYHVRMEVKHVKDSCGGWLLAGLCATTGEKIWQVIRSVDECEVIA